MTHRWIDVWLSDEDMKFIRWMAKRDGVNTSEELRMIFNTELTTLKMLYESEMEGEQK